MTNPSGLPLVCTCGQELFWSQAKCCHNLFEEKRTPFPIHWRLSSAITSARKLMIVSSGVDAEQRKQCLAA
jgi:hypothetical protein